MAFYRRKPRVIEAFTYTQIKTFHEKSKGFSNINRSFLFHNITMERISDTAYMAITENNKVKVEADKMLVIDHENSISGCPINTFKRVYEDI